jgi:Na+/alanine symporter
MDATRDELQFSSLYLTSFAGSLGYMTLLTLLPTYINTLGATGVTVGLFITALEIARTIGIVPLGWAGDRYDKRTVLVGALVLSVVAYLAFSAITSVEGFLAARFLQGFGLTGTGLLGLALVGDLAPDAERANHIGKFNAFRMAAGIAGTLGAGTLVALTGFDLIFGLVLAGLVFIVVVGHIQRVGAVTSRLVPGMVVIYLGITLFILATHYPKIPAALALIVTDAFTGNAVAGGAVGSVIIMGIRRGAFSNEAGIGTESLAHGAARTNEPVREGLVAMLGPVIDTLIVCTCTALAIIVTDAWQIEGVDGITMTANAFQAAIPGAGDYLLTVMVLLLGMSTVFSFWYYGTKCLGFLIGAEHQHHYVWIYCVLVVIGAVMSLDMVVGFVDGMYAAMAIPTMISTLVLAPRVMRAARRYLKRHAED